MCQLREKCGILDVMIYITFIILNLLVYSLIFRVLYASSLIEFYQHVKLFFIVNI